MKLSEMRPNELELMSYADLTYAILKEGKKPMTTAAIFHKICDLLEYSEDEFASKIGDYYTSLTLDKRFVLLDNNEWDIRDNHSIKIELDDEEEEEEEIEEEEEEEEVEEEVEDSDTIYDDENDITDDDDDMDDLSILSDEEELSEE